MYFNMLYVMTKNGEFNDFNDALDTILYFRTDYRGDLMVLDGHLNQVIKHSENIHTLRIDANKRVELDDLLENNSKLKEFNIVTNIKQFCDHYSTRKDE